MKIKHRIRIYLFVLLIGIILIITSVIINDNDNKKAHINNVTSNDLFQTNHTEGLEANLVETNEPWENPVSTFSEDNHSTLYRAHQYNISIKNNSIDIINYYNVKFTANEKTLILDFWCGKELEIHQFRDGKEIIENINIQNVKDNYNIEVYRDYSNKPIYVLEQGDYFIYKPSYIGWEIPMQQGDVTTPGFICFIKDESKNFNPKIEFIYPNFTPLNDDITIFLNSRNQAFGKKVDNDSPNYVMDTFDIQINNKEKRKISSYSFKIEFNEKCYLNNMWNGAIEIHQNVNGIEKTQLIENPSELKRLEKAKELNLDYIVIDNEIFVTLNEGDYLISNPNNEPRTFMYDKIVDNGIILLYPNNEPTPNINIELTYYINTSISIYPLFWIGYITIIFIIIIIIFEVLMQYRVKKYIVQKQHDEKIIVESIETFTSFIDAKDPYTKGHSNRVSEYAREIAKALNMSIDECQKIYYIALMHDCGKIGIPDNILTKPGKLTLDEYGIIKTHTTIGYEILKNFTSIDGIRDGALYHHERYDGKGYPKGLKGEEIPLVARIICVADSFDAMTTNRCYRDALSKEKVISELVNNKGTQFDPNIVDVFLMLIDEDKIKL